MSLLILSMALLISQCKGQTIHESDMNFRIDPGARTCLFESGKVGQVMEVFYQVLDGQHGDLDINFEILDPKGEKLVSDYKKPENSIIMNVTVDGDYVFCMDNSYSLMNSKLVFVYVVIEDRASQTATQHVGDKEEIVEWKGVNASGEVYYLEVRKIIESLTRTLHHVLRARHLLEMYGAKKSRDSYMAFEDTFIVDIWSAFQISFMMTVGMLQVYMIKKLFSKCP